ncbi:MAG: HAD hydrolase family protein, partial [Gammaproteobacteria bacterium]|nr:HAD hydrolase family protein [Gammaproteobacteria bacterium]
MIPKPHGLRVSIPGKRALRLTHVLLDFNGTLALDGRLLPGVKRRLRRLARTFTIHVLTADTFGSAARSLRGLPVHLTIVRTGEDKRRWVTQIGRRRVVAIGNGRNDVAMLRAAALSVVVIGPEGARSEALHSADLIATHIG